MVEVASKGVANAVAAASSRILGRFVQKAINFTL